MQKPLVSILVIPIIFGLIGGFIAVFVSQQIQGLDQNAQIKDFYDTETAVHVSPHHIRKAIAEGKSDFVLVDLRSQEEYEREHVIGAVSIPAYKTPDKSAYGDVDRIVNAFRALPKDKDIIVYCYSIPCMTGRKVGKMLADHDIYVKHLGIGWNEWRHFWTLWNHEHEWADTKVEDYVISGSEPGALKGELEGEVCDIKGEFGC